jgi:ribonuclease P protein component
MLGAGQRMRRRDEFTSALRAGRRARRGDLVLHLSLARPATAVSTAATPDHRSALDEARAGFIIPRTVGIAVVRNTIRRRLRHLLRERLTVLPAGSLLVVRVLPGGGGRTYAELARDLDAALTAVTRASVTRPSQESGPPSTVASTTTVSSTTTASPAPVASSVQVTR